MIFDFRNDSINFLPVSTNMNYLENGLYKSLIININHPAEVPTKSDMNCLASLEVIQISSF